MDLLSSVALPLPVALRPGAFNRIRNPNKAARAAIVLALENGNVRCKLTPQLVADLRPPTDRHEAFAWDVDTRGWGVRVLKSGRRAWVVQYRHRGRSIRRTIGACDRLPYTLAKERAKEVLALSDLGRDWFAEEAARVAAERAADAADAVDNSLGTKLGEYLADPETGNKRTYPAISRYLTRVWAPLHGMSAETIMSRDISRHLEQIAVDSGIVAANRARGVLFTAFKWLLDTHRLERDDNPAARARRWKEQGRRRRAPSLQELAAIWRAAGKIYPDTAGAIVRLLILTAARKSEIALLIRPEVDLQGTEILLPPERVKIGQPHWIPLSRLAVALLRGLPARSGLRLFPTISWARCKPLLDEAAGVDGWTLHDLRRSFSSLARDELHVDSDDVERTLGHIPAGVRGRYDFSERKRQRRALAEAWARLVLQAAGEPVDDVPVLRVVEGGGR